jgi:hypothetical protein
MPNLDAKIEDFVEGDSFAIRRTVKRTASGLATGVTVTKAWFTIKALLADADPGLVQKEITTGDVPGTGQIEDDGGGDVNPVLRFDILAADTRAVGPTERYYDIQLLLSDGTITTPEAGTIEAVDDVTTTDS